MEAVLSDVRVLRASRGPLNLLIQGREVGTSAIRTEVAFSGADETRLPPELAFVEIVELEGTRDEIGTRLYAVRSKEREYVIRARNAFVHRDVSVVVCAAVPPRRAPIVRRAIWNALPAIMGSNFGRRVLRAFRRA